MAPFNEQNQSGKVQNELLGEKRQEKTLREFKQVVQDLLVLLRQATDMETVYMYWVNHAREQFVLESISTRCYNTIFQDRVDFEQHFLNDFKDLDEPIHLELGKELNEDSLIHYYEDVPVNYLTLLPFVNNRQTIAITVLESRYSNLTDEEQETIYAYNSALSNLLSTYLELNDLSEHQQEWINYEERLTKFDGRLNTVQLLPRLLDEMQDYLQQGGVSLLAQGMGSWNVVMNSTEAYNPPPLGLEVQQQSIAYDALQRGEAEFSIHFNSNPKRISPREPLSNGASLAIPILINDRRHAVLLAYDENPLVFKDSAKHKLINLVRMASLKLAILNPNLGPEASLLANQYKAYHWDVWEQILDTELKRLDNDTQIYTWLALITPADISSLRTKYRLKQLQTLQTKAVQLYNPGGYGVSGLVGSHSDYIYAVILQGSSAQLVEQWLQVLDEELANPISLDEESEPLVLKSVCGYTMLQKRHGDVQELIKEAKQALSEAVKNQDQENTAHNVRAVAYDQI